MNNEARKTNRLKSYNYNTNAAYSLTICTKNKKKILSKIVGDGLDRPSIKLTKYGEIAEAELLDITNHFNGVVIDKYVIMPNHIHVIIRINKDDTIQERSRPFPTISTIIGLYKSGASKKAGISLWQRSFYDRVIRNEPEYQKIWQYIEENPACWQTDKYFVMEESND